MASGDLATSADLIVTKEFGVDSFEAGAPVTFTLDITNDGPSDALAATVTDELPAGLTIAADADITIVGDAICSRATTTVADDTLSCDLATVAVGESITITVEAATDPTMAAGPITNTATGATSTADRNPSNHTASDTVEVERSANLAIDTAVIAPVDATVVAGQTANYQVTVNNNGPSTATATGVADELPDGVTLVDGSIVVGPQGTCALDGTVIRCDLGDLAPGITVTIDYQVTVGSDVDAGTLTNTATVSSTTPNNEPEPATADIEVDTIADLEVVSKTSAPEPVLAGDDVTYTVTMRNNGPSVARNAVFSDTIPAGLTVDESSQPASCSVAADTLTCALGDLDPVARQGRGADAGHPRF